MRISAFVGAIGLLLVVFPPSVQAQETIVQEVNHGVAEVAEPAVEGAEAQAKGEAEASRVMLRRAESEFVMTGEGLKEIAVGPVIDGAAAEGKVVISTTAIIIGLLVLILIT